jgi:hypothetical protein
VVVSVLLSQPPSVTWAAITSYSPREAIIIKLKTTVPINHDYQPSDFDSSPTGVGMR